MAQRFGAVLAIAIGSTVFASYGGLASPATVTAGSRPALWACAVFAAPAALAGMAMSARSTEVAEPQAIEAPMAA
jgi:hypothetical protein